MKSPEFQRCELEIRECIHQVGLKADLLAHIRDEIRNVLDRPNPLHADYVHMLGLLREARVNTLLLDTASHNLELALANGVNFLEGIERDSR